MAKKLSPQDHFYAGALSRQQNKLPQGNPYKFIEARSNVELARQQAIAALQYHRSPRKGGAWDNLGGFLAHERVWYTAKLLRKILPFCLGRNAVPGLQVMGRPEVFEPFHDAMVNQILPEIAHATMLPRGEPMMEELVRICEKTIDLMNKALRGMGIHR